MKILVTGSNGRIGANLVRRLLQRGHEIRGFVFPGDASRVHKLDGIANVELVEGDLRDYAAVERAVKGVDAVYHIAAAFASPHSNLEYLQINGLGTLHLLEAIRAHAPELQRLVYACTEAVYWRTEDDGRLFEQPIREDEVSHSKLMPYYLTKWIGEELCMNYHYQYGVPTVVCRFATVLEPSELLDEEGIPRYWSVAHARERLQALPDPSPAAREALQQLDEAWQAGRRLLLSRCPDGRSFKQEWGDVRDIAKGLALALDAEAAVGEAFTVGGLLTVWEELVPALAERLGVGYADVRMPSPNYFEFDHTKVRELLGYTPDHDFWSTLDAALAIRAGRETDVVPTGVRYGGAESAG
jgi:nucleoside-diphosphate-sugar epimerase